MGLLGFFACFAVGCVSVADDLDQGRASFAAGNLQGADVAFHTALKRARSDIEGEHYVHLQQPLWIDFSDACVALGGFLERTEGASSADRSLGGCLSYAASTAATPYFAASVALRVEAAWANLAQARRTYAPAVSHGIIAEALRSMLGRKTGEIVVDHAWRVSSSATDMFLSMGAAHDSGEAARQANDALVSRQSSSQASPVLTRVADDRWAMIMPTGGGLADPERLTYGALLSKVPVLDRAVGARVALQRFPGIAELPQARALLASAWKIESAAGARTHESLDDEAAFESALTGFFGWLGTAG